jgi:hypothetical protein
MAQQKPTQPTGLPPLEEIVQKMVDAGESEENIASVIQHYKGGGNSVPPTMLQGQPTDFWGGVKKSFTSGEAGNAMDEGARGWLKGAVADLPSSIVGGLGAIGRGIYHSLDSDPNTNSILNLPSDIKNMASNAWNTTKQAGSNPNAFGEMMGQVGGQPLVTAGITKGVPMLRNPVGSGIEAVGNTMEKYQPVSGMLPRIAEMRTMRNVERSLGGKVSELGSKIKKPPVIQGEIVGPPEPSFSDVYAQETNPNEPPALNKPDSTILPNNTTETRQYRMLPDNKSQGLPPSDTSFYGNIPVETDPTKMLPKFGGSTVNPLITKSMEAPIHPLDEMINSLNLNPGELTSVDKGNNIISNFQKRQIPDPLQKPPESPVAGPVSEVGPNPQNDVEQLISSLGLKNEAPSPTIEPPTMGKFATTDDFNKLLKTGKTPEEINQMTESERNTLLNKTTNNIKSNVKDTVVHTGPDEFNDLKVWHNIGRNKYMPNFSNTLDKIKFIAGQTVKNAQTPKYLKFIMDQTGMNESDALSSAREFRLHAKELMEGKKPGVIKIPSIGGQQ